MACSPFFPLNGNWEIDKRLEKNVKCALIPQLSKQHSTHTVVPRASPGPSAFLPARNSPGFQLVVSFSSCVSLSGTPSHAFLSIITVSQAVLYFSELPQNRFHGLLWDGRRRAHLEGVREGRGSKDTCLHLCFHLIRLRSEPCFQPLLPSHMDNSSFKL